MTGTIDSGTPNNAPAETADGDYDPANPFKGVVSESYTDGNLDKPAKGGDDKEEGDADDSSESGDDADGDASDSGDSDADEGDDSDADNGDADADPEGEGESEDEDEDEDATEDDEDVDPPKPKKSVSKRIDELTRARRAAEEERDRLRAELDAAKKGKKPAGQDDEDDLTEGEEEATDNKRPEAKDYQYGEIDPEFIEALADWKVEQKLNEREAKAEKKRQDEAGEQIAQEFVKDLGRVFDTGKKAYPKDFQAKVIDAANKGQWDLAPATALLISKSKVGHHVAYHLATNRGVAKEIAKLDQLDQARRFGRLEARYLAKAKPTTPKPPKAKPMPDQPRGASGKFSTSPDSPDFNAFEKMARDTLKIED